MYELPIVVLGNYASGKSAITIQFTQNLFVADYDPTFEDFFTRTIAIDGKDFHFSILDTAGADDFSVFRLSSIRKANGFVIIYSIDDRKSFNDVKFWYSFIREKDAPFFICGNKIDLDKMTRVISQKEGKALAKKLGGHFIETSAMNNTNVEEMFIELGRLIVEKEKLQSMKLKIKKQRRKIKRKYVKYIKDKFSLTRV